MPRGLIVPADEVLDAAAVLSDLEWLMGEIQTARDDAAQIERQRRAAGLLFSSLDDPAKLPALVCLLESHEIDSSVILGWYSSGGEPSANWQRRLAYVRRSVDVLGPVVQRGAAALDAPARAKLTAALQTRRASLESWIVGPGPFP
jgi:hypothetical protein